MLGIFETQLEGNLIDRFASVKNLLLRYLDQLGLNVLLGRLTGFSFDQISKLFGRQVQFVGAISNRRQADRIGFIG